MFDQYFVEKYPTSATFVYYNREDDNEYEGDWNAH